MSFAVEVAGRRPEESGADDNPGEKFAQSVSGAAAAVGSGVEESEKLLPAGLSKEAVGKGAGRMLGQC